MLAYDIRLNSVAVRLIGMILKYLNVKLLTRIVQISFAMLAPTVSRTSASFIGNDSGFIYAMEF